MVIEDVFHHHSSIEIRLHIIFFYAVTHKLFANTANGPLRPLSVPIFKRVRLMIILILLEGRFKCKSRFRLV